MTRSASAAFLAIAFFGFGSENVNFDNQKPAAMPAWWSAGGPAAKWQVLKDATAPSRPNVFAQSSNSGREMDFPLAIFDKVVCRDGDLSVKFKISKDSRRFHTAGIVWRYQDPRNYYLLHFSSDDKNIVMFRVQDGKPRALPVLGARPGQYGVSHDLQAGQWYVVKVIYRGEHFRVSFGNRRLFDAVDSSITTPGKTGLWTRGGTSASFDDFRIDKKA